MTDRPGDLAQTAILLNAVFGVEPPMRVRDLEWHYLDNPRGTASVGRVETGDERLANYALVHQRYVSGGTELRLGLGVDLAVTPGARGKGTFRAAVEDAYARGAGDGLHGILGVANANSAPRMIERLGWRAYDRLPAVVALPSPRRRRLAHHEATGSYLASDLFRDATAGGFAPSGGGYRQDWDRELLRWRLAKPGARYTVHHDDDVLVVSTTTRIRGVRFAVIAKVLPRRPQHRPLALGPIATAVQLRHRSPAAIYWGRNPDIDVSGMRIPDQAMPSPLQIVLHSFHPDFVVDDFDLEAFEFLDFDAF